MPKFLPASLALALSLPIGAMADTTSDVRALQKEMKAMRADYEARLKALEQRVKSAEAAVSAPGTATAKTPASATAAAGTAAVATAPADTWSPPTTVAQPSPQATPAAAAAPATVASAGGGGGANAFNPALSLILSGGYTHTSRDPADYRITGFPLPPGAEIGPGTRNFSLGETELGFSASVDPWFRGAANISVAADNSVSIEEAFVETTALGKGFTLKGGRFFSGVGYLNPQHSHTWDFVDAPLAYQAMLGTQYGDDGVQLKWLAPIDQYLELGAELGRGRTFPGSDKDGNGAGMYALYAHTGGDIGVSNSWRAGISMLSAKASDQTLTGVDAAGLPFASQFTGNSRVWVLDGVWKWAPNGNATRTNFKLQGEYLRSQRDGSMVLAADGSALPSPYGVTQSGWYLQGVYQFMPAWRIGLRTEQLDPGTPSFGLDTGLVGTGYRAKKNSIMLDYNPSEFSRIRLQFAQDRAREGKPDNQISLQYQMSLGAHGAHSY
ncbi:porin [Variovorax sp. dw_308]|uniref:porin n=1 Tax=Variovorax sp. dw_308 TaxID=2721546 RepID=UPI001C441331|nr:porin [Variovorax sp. dw_308]